MRSGVRNWLESLRFRPLIQSVLITHHWRVTELMIGLEAGWLLVEWEIEQAIGIHGLVIEVHVDIKVELPEIHIGVPGIVFREEYEIVDGI